MEKTATLVFTHEDISDFCELTGDDNGMHNPDIMGKFKKEPIVPGMQLLTRAAKLVGPEFERVKQYDFYFGMPVSANESLRLVVNEMNDFPYSAKISIFANGSDALAVKDNTSGFNETLSLATVENYDGDGSVELYPPVDAGESFAKTSGIDDKRINNFLYAVALSSQALLKRIKFPKQDNELEKKLHDDMYPTDRNKELILPVYTAFHITAPHGAILIDINDGLNFNTRLEQVQNSKRDFIFYLSCSQERVLYTGVYGLKAIPAKILRRGAKDSTAA